MGTEKDEHLEIVAGLQDEIISLTLKVASAEKQTQAMSDLVGYANQERDAAQTRGAKLAEALEAVREELNGHHEKFLNTRKAAWGLVGEGVAAALAAHKEAVQ